MGIHLKSKNEKIRKNVRGKKETCMLIGKFVVTRAGSANRHARFILTYSSILRLT